jgi:hypothetical protein
MLAESRPADDGAELGVATFEEDDTIAHILLLVFQNASLRPLASDRIGPASEHSRRSCRRVRTKRPHLGAAVSQRKPVVDRHGGRSSWSRQRTHGCVCVAGELVGDSGRERVCWETPRGTPGKTNIGSTTAPAISSQPPAPPPVLLRSARAGRDCLVSTGLVGERVDRWGRSRDPAVVR